METVVFTGFEGVQLVADIRGDPDGWPVLLLHGGGQTRHAWGTAAERIAEEGWRTVSLDLRGHGESDWAPRSDYSFTAFGSDVVEHYANGARVEIAAFDAAVTDWELRRGFERL